MKLLNTPQKSTKTGKNFRGGGKNLSGWPEYIPLVSSYTISNGILLLNLPELYIFF